MTAEYQDPIAYDLSIIGVCLTAMITRNKRVQQSLRSVKSEGR